MRLKEINLLVEQGLYHYSEKVQKSIEEGFFDERDLESCILSATKIPKKEKVELGQAVHGMKYVILSRDTHGQPFYTIGKVIQGAQGKLYYYISAHRVDDNH